MWCLQANTAMSRKSHSGSSSPMDRPEGAALHCRGWAVLVVQSDAFNRSRIRTVIFVVLRSNLRLRQLRLSQERFRTVFAGITVALKFR